MSLALEVLPPEPKQPLKRLTKITTIDDLWSVFVRLRGQLSKNTLSELAVIGRMFCNFMRDRKLDAEAIMEWRLHVQEGRTGSTVNKINKYVRPFLKWLQTMNYVREPLYDQLPWVHEVSKEPAIFTEEEYEKIKAYCTGRNWCQVHLWLIILGYRTGMSLIDCCHLRWCNVHLNDDGPSFIDIHRIKIARHGSKALCQIPIIPGTDVHEWLLNLKKIEHLNYQRHDGIKDFVHQDAPGFYACTFQRLPTELKQIFQRSGVHGKTFRNLRNSFCSNLVNSGTQIALVCKMTGHNNVEMLLRYLKADRRALQDGLSNAFQYSATMAGIGKGADGINNLSDE